jgi:uncharacterized membrane protein YedE/YeeE
MSHLLSSLISGIIFGVGLALSGMIDPNKVLNFLDFSGNWDPSLALVMTGALAVSFVAFQVIPKRVTPCLVVHLSSLLTPTFPFACV